MKHRVLYPRIVLVQFEKQYDMCSALMRFQEHYESPRFRGKLFDHEAFMDWYASDNEDVFSYFEDWEGFNFPNRVMQPFYKGRFDPLFRKEQRFLKSMRQYNRRWGVDWYVIGCLAGKKHELTLKHEIAHAFFSVDEDYRRAVLDAVRAHKTESIKQQLERMGYHESVFEDEVHAYIMTDPPNTKMSPRRLAPLRRKLQRLFREAKARAA